MTEATPLLIPLPAVLDTTAAETLARQVRAAAAAARPMVFAADAVQRLGTAGAQVLLATAASGLPFQVKAPSDAFVTAFEELGLFATLMAWPVTE